MRSAPLALLAVLLLSSVPSTGQPQPATGFAERQDVSPPLRDIQPVVPVPGPARLMPNRRYDHPPHPKPPALDPLLSSSTLPVPSTQSTTPPFRNLEGISADEDATVVGFRGAPPDPVGDVGPTHYVQAVNLLLAVYDKSTGSRIYGPVPIKTLWSGFGGDCEANNDGDPIVLYDDAANRWLISQFSAWTGDQCIAVSTSGDPTGSYYRYEFAVSLPIGDYPKIGVWPDGYYMSYNEFDDLGTYYGVGAVAFERSKMLIGAAAQKVVFNPHPCGDWNPAPECPFSLQPAHWEGGTPPPAGAPNTFLMAWDDEANGTGTKPDGYRLWEFQVNWTNLSASTFSSIPQVDAPEMDRLLTAGVSQPAPGEPLDTLSDLTMYRLQYRNFGTYQTLVTNLSVDVDGANRVGIRWAELRKSGTGAWTLHQTGTFSPDALHRWNGSIAMDGQGHIALSYSVASSSKHASIRYVSRTSADPLGTLPGGEVELVAGSGIQQNSSGRWGDYSAISVDPADDCTFWFTQEYLTDSGQYDWKTRIGAFNMCGQGSCTPTQNPETSCSDGIDNDCDGSTDMADLDCSCGNGVKDPGEACDGSDLGGQTCVGLGFGGGTLTCSASCAFNTSGCTSPPVTTTFTSAAADDGYVLESGETTNAGGSSDSAGSSTSAIRAGDAKQDKQYRGLLSFDTAAIPDGATVQAATLRVRRGSLTGTSPFTTHGSLSADIRTGGFNGNAALENADFQAAATATAVCTLSNAPANGDWSECTLNAAGLAAVNKTGKTQIRIRFTLDDNDDNGDDYIGFYSGNNATAANHPQLVVTHQ